MKLHGAEIVDTFAEAFPMRGARVVITAATPAWALEVSLDDRLRHVGDRVQVRGGHRARELDVDDARLGPGRSCCSRWTATGWPSGSSSASARPC